MNSFIPLLLSLIALVWVIVLTVLSMKYFSFTGKIEKESKQKSLSDLLQEVLQHEKTNASALSDLKVRCDALEKSGSFHLQKMGLVRFNPFKDTGGDQSFILSLVDANDTGIVISSLHTRTGTRWYAKRVVKGKGVEYDLSDEEAKAIHGAKDLSS